MSTRYFEQIGTNGKAIIDDNVARYVLSRVISGNELTLIASTSISYQCDSYSTVPNIPDSLRVSSFSKYSLTLTDDECIIAIRSKLKNKNIGYLTRPATDGKRFTVYIANGKYSGQSLSAILTNLEIYIYREKPVTQSSKFGLEIRNSEGNIIFNSNYRILDIKGAYLNTNLQIGNYRNGRSAMYGISNINWTELALGLDTEKACIINSYIGCVYNPAQMEHSNVTAYVVFASDGVYFKVFSNDYYYSRVYIDYSIYQANWLDGMARAYCDNCSILSVKV